MEAFIIFIALLCILSPFVSFASITLVVADDQHHNNSRLHFLSKKTGLETWTIWMYWHASAWPMPSFRKDKVIVDSSPQLCGPAVKSSIPRMAQPLRQPFSLKAWEDPFQNKQQRDDVMGIKGFEIKTMHRPMGHRICELLCLSALASNGTYKYALDIATTCKASQVPSEPVMRKSVTKPHLTQQQCSATPRFKLMAALTVSTPEWGLHLSRVEHRVALLDSKTYLPPAGTHKME